MPNLGALFKARRNLILLLGALVVVLAVGIGACGGGDDASDSAEPAAVEEPTDFTEDPVEDPPPPPEDPPETVTTDTETVPEDDLPTIKLKGKALKKGVENKRVEQLQLALIYIGLLEEGAADGNFGSGTKRGVQAFQLEKGLKSDGVAGKKTIRAINKSVKQGERFDDFTSDGATADTGDTTADDAGNGSGDDSADGDTGEPS